MLLSWPGSAASEGALHQLTTSLSALLAPRGISVNTINPGATDTGYATEEQRQAIIAVEPSGHWGWPEDAARLIDWLATDDACRVTGQVINSTGDGPEQWEQKNTDSIAAVRVLKR